MDLGGESGMGMELERVERRETEVEMCERGRSLKEKSVLLEYLL